LVEENIEQDIEGLITQQPKNGLVDTVRNLFRS